MVTFDKLLRQMNISDHTDYMLSHPALINAVKSYEQGNVVAMRDFLERLQLHCIDVQVKASAKEYGSCKRMNGSDIKNRLFEMKQPENLNIYLPIPKDFVVKQPVMECKVINFTQAVKKKAARFFDPGQLVFPFPDYRVQVSL